MRFFVFIIRHARKWLRLQASQHGYNETQKQCDACSPRSAENSSTKPPPSPPPVHLVQSRESTPNIDGTPSCVHNYTSCPYFRCPRCSPSMSIVIPFLKSAVDPIDNAPAPPRVGRGAATVHRATTCDCTKDPCFENIDARTFECKRARSEVVRLLLHKNIKTNKKKGHDRCKELSAFTAGCKPHAPGASLLPAWMPLDFCFIVLQKKQARLFKREIEVTASVPTEIFQSSPAEELLKVPRRPGH